MNKKLIKAVIKQLGHGKMEGEIVGYLEEVTNHGAVVGFSGFCYYSDTVAFFRKNKKLIVELAENMAEALGEDVISMIQNFNCLEDDRFSSSQIGKVLYGRVSDSDDNTMIMNALSWFALEEVARYIIDAEEN